MSLVASSTGAASNAGEKAKDPFMKCSPQHPGRVSPNFRPRPRPGRLLVVAAIALLALLAQTSGRAAPGDVLSYSGGLLVTGNYVVSTTDLTEQANPIDQDGFSTGTLPVSGVPADADIVAAYLYWETITLAADLNQAAGVTFRGNPISLDDVSTVKKNSVELTGTTASCWSSGQPLAMTGYRADVLRFLPVRLDKDDQPTGKRLVNDADLIAHNQPLHQVRLPARQGNQIPETAGASLVVVFVDRSEPLRKIVFYDGIHVQSGLDEVTTQSLQGFYRSSAAKSAQVTPIIASGQPNANERILFNGSNSPNDTVISPANPVAGGTASQRGWAALTYNVSALMTPGANSAAGFGETVTTRIDHAGGGGYDCLTLQAVVFSTAVADDEANPDNPLIRGDGLPDGLEDAAGGLNDPDGQPLPNLNAMGASSAQRDLFVEFNAMWAAAGTSYGSSSAPYDSTTNVKVDGEGHHHYPTPADLKMIGDRFAAHGIDVHFDVGDIAAYHQLGTIQHDDWIDDYTALDADGYLVPSAHARGGEKIKEVSCNPATPPCQFPDYPGTVGWKLGLQAHRDAPVTDSGAQFSTDPADPDYFDWSAGTQRRRFDRARVGLFHYLLYAHSRGTPKSTLPCIVNGQPAPYHLANGTACTTPNPDFHVPTSASGVADVPGGNAMVSLGRWDEFVGRPFVRASTTFHEIGHNLDLWHGGLPVVWGNKAAETATYVEPNCKPNHPSSISYLYQVHGLFDDLDRITLDFSPAVHTPAPIETATLVDAPLFPVPGYRSAWYAPAGSARALEQAAPAATRFCNGLRFDPAAPPAPMARVVADFAGEPIDWNGDLLTNTAPAQDVNFDASMTAGLSGANDWGSVRLNQISAGVNRKVFSSGDDFFVNLGGGDDFFVNLGGGDDFFVNLGGGDDFFVNLGGGDDFFVNLGGGDDFFVNLGGGAQRELDYEIARGLGRTAPYSLAACVIGAPGCSLASAYPPSRLHRNEVRWSASTVGHVFAYQVQRKTGPATAAASYVTIGTSTTNSFVDTEELPNGVQFTYRVRAEFDDVNPHAFSGWSRPVTITAVNDAPLAVADGYTMNQNTTLNVSTPGVLGNDTDTDSPTAFIGRRAVLVTGPATGSLTLNANGSFTYKPPSSFIGTVSFTYKADDGPWSADASVPLSGFSGNATVTITVKKKK